MNDMSASTTGEHTLPPWWEEAVRAVSEYELLFQGGPAKEEFGAALDFSQSHGVAGEQCSFCEKTEGIVKICIGIGDIVYTLRVGRVSEYNLRVAQTTLGEKLAHVQGTNCCNDHFVQFKKMLDEVSNALLGE